MKKDEPEKPKKSKNPKKERDPNKVRLIMILYDIPAYVKPK